MVSKLRTIILIDGSNFYFKLKDLDLPNLVEFDFQALAKHLAERSNVIQATYYVGAIQTNGSKRSARMFANQRRLLAHLRTCNFTYYLGYLLKSNGIYKEKGVDVKIATDLLIGACQNKYDQAFLISSDSDLIPAIEGAQSLGKTVVYVGFKHLPSYSLLQNCKRSILLDKEDLLPFVKTNSLKKDT